MAVAVRVLIVRGASGTVSELDWHCEVAVIVSTVAMISTILFVSREAIT